MQSNDITVLDQFLPLIPHRGSHAFSDSVQRREVHATHFFFFSNFIYYNGIKWFLPQATRHHASSKHECDQFIWLPGWHRGNKWLGQIILRKYAKGLLEVLIFPVRRRVTAVCSGGIKNWSCMQGKDCWAPGDRRKVPYEKLKETGDGARARLPFLLSSSTSQQCACSRREHSPAS